jgi:hypothetical protein
MFWCLPVMLLEVVVGTPVCTTTLPMLLLIIFWFHCLQFRMKQPITYVALCARFTTNNVWISHENTIVLGTNTILPKSLSVNDPFERRDVLTAVLMEDPSLLGCDAVSTGKQLSKFRRNVLSPSSRSSSPRMSHSLAHKRLQIRHGKQNQQIHTIYHI